MDKKLLFALIFSCSWALSIFIRKLALNEGVQPLPFLLESSGVSVLVLTVYILFAKRKSLQVFKNSTVLKQFAILGFFIGGAWIFDTLGLSYTSSVNYSFIIKTGLIFSILFASVFLHEAFTKKKLLLILLLLCGAYLITTGGTMLLPSIGDLIVVLAAFLYSSATIIQKILTKRVDAELIGWGRVVSGFFILLLWLFMTGTIQFTNGYLSYILLAGILLCLTTVFLNKSLEVSSVSYVTIMTMTVPIMSALLGIIFLHESINSFQIMGGLIIIVSGIVININKKII